jgi:flagellar hook protein FlgE
MPFRVAISGLRAAQTDLNVIGNNIANVNTTGFKQSRSEFHDVYSASAVGGSGDVSPGRGVNTARVAQLFTQGNVSFTDRGLDLAISGQGFFILDDNGARVYARDGAFGLDREGFVVNSSGLRVVAFEADASGNVSGATQPLQITLSDIAPVATSDVDINLNLDASESPPPIAVFDPLDSDTYTSSTAVSIYDSLGTQHTMQVFFVKTAAPNTWDAYSVVDGVTVGGPDALTFSSTGALVAPAGGQITIPAFSAAPGADPMNITLNLLETTQFGSPFGVNALVQNGYASGRLSGLDIDEAGLIFARFTNGRSEIQGQLALANFANTQGLQSLGENTWAETFASGPPLEGAPGTASLGLIQSGALEDSNVDLSEQLVQLIIAQRNFQANTEVISAADAVQQAVINIR